MEAMIKNITCNNDVGLRDTETISNSVLKTENRIKCLQLASNNLRTKERMISELIREKISVSYLPESGSNDISIDVMPGNEPGENRIEVKIGYTLFNLLVESKSVPDYVEKNKRSREKWFVDSRKGMSVTHLFCDIYKLIEKLINRQEEQLKFLTSEMDETL